MASKLQDFFKKAVSSQLAIAGTDCHAFRKSTKSEYDFKAVLTSRDGSLTATYGATEYTVSAHILIPKNSSYVPIVGDRVTSDGSVFIIVNTIASPDDGAYSCDLVSVQK